MAVIALAIAARCSQGCARGELAAVVVGSARGLAAIYSPRCFWQPLRL